MQKAENEIVEYLHSAFNDLSTGNLVQVVVTSMEMVQVMDGFNGSRKKKVVIDSVTRFVDEKDLLGPMEDILLNLVPVMIDNLIAADRGKLVLHPQVTKTAMGCFSLCKKKVPAEKSN